MKTIAEHLREEGEQRGIAKGIEKGIEKGVEKRSAEIAQLMLADQHPLEYIMK